MTTENNTNKKADSRLTLMQVILEYGPMPKKGYDITFARIMDELTEMHEKGLCHNDICPDNITVEIRPRGGVDLHLNDSAYAAVPSRGKAVLNVDDNHRCFWAPENHIGETSFLSDQHQLARTMYFAFYGKLPGVKETDCENKCWVYRELSPDDFDNTAMDRGMVKALRLNPTERFRSMYEWSYCLLDNFTQFNAYSDYYFFQETMTSHGHLWVSGDHRQTYCDFFGSLSGKPNSQVMQVYERMGVIIHESSDFRCYNRDFNVDEHTYAYFPNGRCSQIFRLMTASLSVREHRCANEKQTGKGVCDVVNMINRTSNDIRCFMSHGLVFLSYEKLMDESTDYEKMINEAHKALLDADVVVERLLKGETIEERELPKVWGCAPVFYINEGNADHMQDVIDMTNVSLAKTRCVVRDDAVCIEGPQESIRDGVEVFEFIKNYSYL